MKIGIIGANGRVGKELSVLLNETNHEIVSIVRNEFGASFFDYHDLPYRIGEITNEETAKEHLADIDAVVIAARPKGPTPREERETTHDIIKNSISCSSNNSAVIFFSSIVVFGDRVFASAKDRSEWNSYRLNKKHSERLVEKYAAEFECDYFNLRLGHVFGVSQPRAKRIKNLCDKSKNLFVNAEPERLSNVLHTVTLAEAIRLCADNPYDSGTYSVVNEPQWTWRDIFNYYSNEQNEIHYVPSHNKRSSAGIMKKAGKTLMRNEDLFIPFFNYLPKWFNRKFHNVYLNKQMINEIESYETQIKEDLAIYMPIFDYDPIPRPFLKDLPKTTSTLDTEASIEQALVELS